MSRLSMDEAVGFVDAAAPVAVGVLQGLADSRVADCRIRFWADDCKWAAAVGMWYGLAPKVSAFSADGIFCGFRGRIPLWGFFLPQNTQKRSDARHRKTQKTRKTLDGLRHADGA